MELFEILTVDRAKINAFFHNSDETVTGNLKFETQTRFLPLRFNLYVIYKSLND